MKEPCIYTQYAYRMLTNAIFLIKHNTDYIHYTFIKKRKVYLKENA